ncbi:MAG: LysR substrate-binding domain-containing protein [Sneathiella sp.]
MMEKRNRHIKIAERVSTRLKLKQLRLLVAVAEHSSILHAAKELNISQPAATKLVKDLEADFGVILFERTNRGAIPTAYGDALVRHGKLILAQISNAAQELDNLNEGMGGRVVVGTLLAASAKLLPKTIERVHRERPNVNIVIRDGTNDILMPSLLTGDLDLVLGRLSQYRHRKQIVQETLLNEKFCIAARADHPLAKEKGEVSFEALKEFDWILPTTDTTLRRQLEAEFLDNGMTPPENAVESVSFLTNRELLKATDMLCAMPYHVIEEEIKDGRFIAIPCPINTSLSPVGVSYRREGGLTPAAAVFLTELKATALELETE